MKSPRNLAKVSAALAIVGIVAAILALNAVPALSSQTQAQAQLLDTSLTRLHSATNSQERMQAARWLGEQQASVSSDMIQNMGRSLRTDTDPTVRAAVAASIGDLAEKQNEHSATAGANEPQMLDVLATAFADESNPSVRARIIKAAGQFKDPDAVTLINRGLIDSDPGVREAAQTAKLSRQRRLLIAFTG
jgi:HEAT repeat protein